MAYLPDSLIDRAPTRDEHGLVVRPLFSGSDPGVLTVQLSPESISLLLSGSLGEPRPSTSDVGQVPYSTTPVTLQASNPDRRGWTLFNDTSHTLFVKLAAGASTGSWSVKLASGSYYELPYPAYTGIITGVWEAGGTGFARVTEMTS